MDNLEQRMMWLAVQHWEVDYGRFPWGSNLKLIYLPEETRIKTLEEALEYLTEMEKPENQNIPDFWLRAKTEKLRQS